MRTYKSLSKVYNKSKIIPYNNQSKFVIMSDCHRGAGNLGDNFLKNQHLFFAALKNYYEKGFTYIELGVAVGSITCLGHSTFSKSSSV